MPHTDLMKVHVSPFLAFWKILVAQKGWDLNIIEYSSLTTFCGWIPEGKLIVKFSYIEMNGS